MVDDVRFQVDRRESNRSRVVDYCSRKFRHCERQGAFLEAGIEIVKNNDVNQCGCCSHSVCLHSHDRSKVFTDGRRRVAHWNSGPGLQEWILTNTHGRPGMIIFVPGSIPSGSK